MVKEINHIVYNVKDISKSKELYNNLLGVEPYVDGPYYVGYKVGEIEIGLTIGAPNGALVYLNVDDIKNSLQSYLESGAILIQDAKDVGSGLMVATIKDLDGNIIGLKQ